MYPIPMFVDFMIANKDKIRLDLLSANFIAVDPRVNSICSQVHVDNSTYQEMHMINYPYLDEDVINAFTDVFDKYGYSAFSDSYCLSILSSIRRYDIVEFLINHPELIDISEFMANPIALPFYVENPNLIVDKKAITRNPAALRFLINNPQHIDWNTIAGIWYSGDGLFCKENRPNTCRFI